MEREHSDLLALYNQLCNDLLHLRTIEKIEKEKESQIAQMKLKILSNTKEKAEIVGNVKACEQIFRSFAKRMEKGGLSPDEKKKLMDQIRDFQLQSRRKSVFAFENQEKDIQLSELWDLLPQTERLLRRIRRK